MYSGIHILLAVQVIGTIDPPNSRNIELCRYGNYIYQDMEKSPYSGRCGAYSDTATSKNTLICGSDANTYENLETFAIARLKQPDLHVVHSERCSNSSTAQADSNPLIDGPICGSDVRTYNNYRELELAQLLQPNLNVLHTGPCIIEPNFKESQLINSVRRSSGLDSKPEMRNVHSHYRHVVYSPGAPGAPGGYPGRPGAPGGSGGYPGRPGAPGGSGGSPGQPGRPGYYWDSSDWWYWDSDEEYWGRPGRPGKPGRPDSGWGKPGQPGRPGRPGYGGGGGGRPGKPGSGGGGGGGGGGSGGRPGQPGSPGWLRDENKDGGRIGWTEKGDGISPLGKIAGGVLNIAEGIYGVVKNTVGDARDFE
ncbi:protein SPT2 homolog [Amyelois transitella]|uniref:protein SPT2 homolog n=1 Tax=Amyelois transitella TaxID=680683 RepID=UPI00298FDEC2|nr:protein SPT2 homolog [Amyelois transitella]